jgi:hypothetical protein
LTRSSQMLAVFSDAFADMTTWLRVPLSTASV